MNILAISSQVVMGHVGNSAAQFVLQVLGHDVWAVPTTVLSHHPGHGAPAGRATPADALDALLTNLQQGGWLAKIDAVMTGYFTGSAQIEVAARHIRALTAVRRDMPVLVDPVIGDGDARGGRIYVAEEVHEAIRAELVPLATIITPNVFELAHLCGYDGPRTRHWAIDAARALGVAEVLVTSAPGAQAGSHSAAIANLAITAQHLSTHATPCAAAVPHGVGDVTAACYFGNRLNGVAVDAAAAAATTTVAALIERAHTSPTADLPLIAGRHLIVDAS